MLDAFLPPPKAHARIRQLRRQAHAALWGQEPFDILVRGVRLVNVLTREIYPANIGLVGDLIAAVEPLDGSWPDASPGGSFRQGRVIIDGGNLYAVPGFIDAHMHLESSFLLPAAFAAAVLPHGTTTVAADPHEIANVAGLAGVKWLLKLSQALPLSIFFLAPTGVPSAPGLETSGAAFGPEEIRAMLGWPRVIGLAEVMDFRAVVAGEARVMGILAEGLRRGTVIDGHCPLLSGRELEAYLVAGIDSDHNDITPHKLKEKLRLGMAVQIQRKALSKELIAVLAEFPGADFMLVTDDVPADDLWTHGHLNALLRQAVGLGLDPLEAIAAATLRPARRLRLYDRGFLAPGRRADLLLLPDLTSFQPELVVAGGKIVHVAPTAKPRLASPAGHIRKKVLTKKAPATVAPSAPFALKKRPLADGRLAVFQDHDFAVKAPSLPPTGHLEVRVIQVNPNDTRTEEVHFTLPVKQMDRGEPGGVGEPQDPAGFYELHWRDSALALAAVVHGYEHLDFTPGSDKPQLRFGLVAGTGLKEGALATTYAHDSHHLLVLGRDPVDMALAANTVWELGGGLVAVRRGQVLATLPLPIAGLLSPEPVEVLGPQLARFRQIMGELGYQHRNPLMSLATLTLPVSPALKLTNRGLVDVVSRKLVPLFLSD